MKASKYMIAAAIAATFVACRKDEVSDAIDDRSTGADPALLSNEDQHVDASQDADAIVEGNDSTYVGDPGAAGMMKTLVTFQPSSLIRRCPVWINGDREFDGHGPKTNAFVQLFISGGTRVRAHVYYKVRETTANWSEAVLNEYITLYTAPAGRTIASINSDDYVGFNYTDASHGLTYVNFGPNQAAWRFIMNGDTQGNDIGNCTTDDSYITVNFNPVRITLI